MPENNEIVILPWHSDFDVGIKSIDNEHKQLVKLLNKLANTLKYDEDFETTNAFTELANYANYHFESEEKVWEEYLPQELLDQHKKIHSSFLPKVQELQDKNKDKPKHVVIEEILKFLIRWLSFHIISDDKRLALMVLKLQEGKSLEEVEQIAQRYVTNSINQLTNIIFALYENLSSNTFSLMREKELLNKIEQQNIEIKNYSEALDKVAIVSKTDLKGVITYVNESFCDISGFSHDELIGKTHNIIRHEDTPSSVFKELWDTIQKGETWEGSIKNKTKSGEVYYVQSTIFPLTNIDGEILEYMSIRFLVTDETQKKRDFKYKVLLAHQELKKEIKENETKIKLLEDKLVDLTMTKNENESLKTKNSQLLGQIDYYENDIKEKSSSKSDKLTSTKKELQRLNEMHQKTLREQKKDKQNFNKLQDENSAKALEVVRLNEELLKQRRIITDLRDTIKHIRDSAQEKNNNSGLKGIFDKLSKK